VLPLSSMAADLEALYDSTDPVSEACMAEYSAIQALNTVTFGISYQGRRQGLRNQGI
jgi:hypothetical protein